MSDHIASFYPPPPSVASLSARQALREKEKGDWKNLTKEEVQELYRFTFCRSFAEMQAPTGEWKMALGGTLIACSLAIWVYLWMKVYGEFGDADALSSGDPEGCFVIVLL